MCGKLPFNPSTQQLQVGHPVAHDGSNIRCCTQSVLRLPNSEPKSTFFPSQSTNVYVFVTASHGILRRCSATLRVARLSRFSSSSNSLRAFNHVSCETTGPSTFRSFDTTLLSSSGTPAARFDAIENISASQIPFRPGANTEYFDCALGLDRLNLYITHIATSNGVILDRTRTSVQRMQEEKSTRAMLLPRHPANRATGKAYKERRAPLSKLSGNNATRRTTVFCK